MTSRMPRERATDDWLEGGDDPTITDRAGLAALTGLAPKEIDRALREGLPTLPRKRGVPTKFSVPAVVQWLLAQQGDSLESAKRRSLQATARKREVEAGRMEGELIPLALYESVVKNKMALFQSELEAIPARVPAEVRELVRAELFSVINRLSWRPE